MNYSNEFLARVYGAYYGCEIYISDQDIKSDNQGFEIGKIEDFGEAYTSKLLLAPLSKISDEDCFELCKMIGFSGHDPNPESESHFDFDPNEVRDNIANAGDEFLSGTFSENQRVVDFLRYRGYDMGYGEIPSLIEAGIAIDKTTLK